MQTDSVSNQREHLILLLANIHIRRNPKTDQQSKVLFKYSITRLIWFKIITFLLYIPQYESYFFLFLSILFLSETYYIFHDSCCSWMTMYWLMWWKDCLRTIRNGANILVARAASGDCLNNLLPSYCCLSLATCTALVIHLQLCCFSILTSAKGQKHVILCYAVLMNIYNTAKI